MIANNMSSKEFEIVTSILRIYKLATFYNSITIFLKKDILKK